MKRVRTRVCCIPFHKPAIQSTNPEQQDAFDELEELVSSGSFSCLFGWLVEQRKCLTDKQLTRCARNCEVTLVVDLSKIGHY